MVQLNPYISFDGDAREAMTFYTSVFGGELSIDTFEAYPMPGITEADKDRVMHAQLEIPGGLVLMGADTPPGTPAEEGSRITVSLSGGPDDDERLRGYWDGLAADGEISMPLEVAPWGAAFGGLTDRYGVQWFVNIGGPAA